MPGFISGSEFRVNTHQTWHAMWNPRVAALADGGYVITWSSYDQDSSGWGIFAQRYSATGAKIGGETQVNTTVYASQYGSVVTGLSDGGYVITWQSEDGSSYGIYAQRYDAYGSKVGADVQVSTYVSDHQHDAAITSLPDGGYVITWTSVGQDGSASGIYCQRYDASGARHGSETRVATRSDNSQYAATVSSLSDGGYVITWTSDYQDGFVGGIYAQRFDSAGAKVGGEIHVSSDGPFDQVGPAVTTLANGSYVIAWTSGGQDGSGDGIYAQRYDRSGNSLGGEVLVNTSTVDHQRGPVVTALADGGYVIAWESRHESPGVFAQRYDASGEPVGGELQINSSPTHGYQNIGEGVSVSALADGSFVVTWKTYLSGVPEGGIFARQFAPESSTAADSGINSLTGTASGDTIDGLSGNDVIAGLSGNDVLTGGEGSDRLFGGTGHDNLSADQSISFDNGNTVDELYAGAGNDFIFSGFGDIVDGGDGFDTVGLSYVGASAGITGDTAILHHGQPLVPGGGTFVSIERFSDIAMTEFDDKMVIGDQHDPATVRAWNGNDHLIGQEVSITMYGGNGHDLLVGSTSFDVLYGESGDDRLIGYTGADVLWGGGGNDRFIFVNLDVQDHVFDFERDADKLDLSDLDANTLMTGDQAFTFIGDASFSGQAGQLRAYTGSNNAYFIAGDVNGDQTADIIVQVDLTVSGAQLTSSDFML